MALERLFAILPELVLGAVGQDLVVQAGPDEPLLVGAQRHGRHAVHGWVSHVLDLQAAHPDFKG